MKVQDFLKLSRRGRHFVGHFAIFNNLGADSAINRSCIDDADKAIILFDADGQMVEMKFFHIGLL